MINFKNKNKLQSINLAESYSLTDTDEGKRPGVKVHTDGFRSREIQERTKLYDGRDQRSWLWGRA